MNSRPGSNRIDLSELRKITDKRNEWLMNELKRVKSLSDDDFAKEVLKLIGRKELFHYAKREIKRKANTYER